MSTYAAPVQDLIDELGRLPGIGPKSAQRIAFHLLKAPAEDAARLSRAIIDAKDKVTAAPAASTWPRGPSAASAPTPAATPR